MTKIYLVTAGIYYSDYHVLAVFSSMKNAQNYCNYIRDNGEDPNEDIEVLELDPSIDVKN